ncbi:ABC transporter permease, partial [Candidatus Woesearchaeota archaeon]|nr:ABC transporter permease [Candidatus Woesearchaeota archaeon]
LWMFAWRSSQDVAVYVLEDFWSRTLYHLFSSPLQVSEYIISTMLFGIFRSLITFAFLVTLGYLVYSFNLFSIPLFFLATAIFLLTLFGWILGLFVTSLILRYGQRIQILAWSSIWLMQPFSAIFYPVSALPAWAVPIAKLLPTTHIFEALRSIISSGKVSSGGLWYAFIVELLLLAIMTLFLYNSFRKAQKSGRLVHGD